MILIKVFQIKAKLVVTVKLHNIFFKKINNNNFNSLEMKKNQINTKLIPLISKFRILIYYHNINIHIFIRIMLLIIHLSAQMYKININNIAKLNNKKYNYNKIKKQNQTLHLKNSNLAAPLTVVLVFKNK